MSGRAGADPVRPDPVGILVQRLPVVGSTRQEL
jgi:hypothetical protein